MPLRDAGPWHDAPDCSQMPIVARLRADRGAGAAARAAHDALGVVRIAGLAAPRAHLLPALRPVDASASASPPGLPGPPLNSCAFGLRVDDRALRAQLRDDRRVERRHVHREVDVVVRRRAHVLRVVRILERRDDAVHRQRGEIRIACRTARRARRRVRAHRAACEIPRTRRARPAGSGPVDGCASNAPLHVTERSPRMFSVSSALIWPAFGMPTRMPICCDDARIRDRRLHAAVLERQALVLIEVREDRRGLDRLASETSSGSPART